MKKYIANKFERADGVLISEFKNGFIDYNDSATHTTPLSYLSGTLKITNDGLGAYSTSTFAPIGVTKFWDTMNNQFDFSQLEVGDEVSLRIDLNVETKAPNAQIKAYLKFDISGFPFNLGIYHNYFKNTGTYNIVETEGFYIGSEGMRDNRGELLFESDVECSIIVNGFYISINKRY